MDTGKLKSELNDIVSSVTSGHPDTEQLKKVGADILTTTKEMLSDSCIDKMYGNDPSAKADAQTLKNLRNKSGLTPDKLDSLSKAVEELNQ